MFQFYWTGYKYNSSATNDFNYESSGTLFYSDSDGVYKTNHTQVISGKEDGFYRINYKCKVESSSMIMSTTHIFRIGQKDLDSRLTGCEVVGGKLKCKVNVTASNQANPGNKTIEIKLKKDDKTIKVLDLDAEVEPIQRTAQSPMSGTLWFLIIMLIALTGALIYLIYKYKRAESKKEGNVVSGYRPLYSGEE